MRFSGYFPSATNLILWIGLVWVKLPESLTLYIRITWIAQEWCCRVSSLCHILYAVVLKKISKSGSDPKKSSIELKNGGLKPYFVCSWKRSSHVRSEGIHQESRTEITVHPAEASSLYQVQEFLTWHDPPTRQFPKQGLRSESSNIVRRSNDAG